MFETTFAEFGWISKSVVTFALDSTYRTQLYFCLSVYFDLFRYFGTLAAHQWRIKNLHGKDVPLAMRKGMGEWQFIPTEQELIWLQIMFSRSIRESASQVLKDLGKASFNSFIAAGLDALSDQELNSIWVDLSNYLGIKDDPTLSEDYGLSPSLQSFRNDLWDWSKRHYLNSDWWRKLGFYTLRIWTEQPIQKEDLFWYPITVGYARSGPDPEPDQGLLRWYPAIQSEEDYLAEVESRAKEHIREVQVFDRIYVRFNRVIAEHHIERVNAHIKEHESLAQRVTEAPLLEAHIRWSVKALVLGMTYDEIADEEGSVAPHPLNPDTVRKAVVRILKAIGLSRKKGHPKGRKNSKTRNTAR